MTNLTHSSFLRIYFSSLHVSSNLLLIIRGINCINTTSGICLSESVTVSCAGPTCTRNGHLVRVTYIPEVVLIQLIPLMMSTRLLETRRELKQIQRRELCVNLVIYQEWKLECPETSVNKYQSTLCNILEERNSQSPRLKFWGKSRKWKPKHRWKSTQVIM
jgi:hypothetical protein